MSGAKERLERLDDELAATILAEASYARTGAVAARFGVTTQTIRNYKARAETDPRFAEIVERKRAFLESEWKDVAIRFLRTGITKLEQLVKDAKAEPGTIREVAGAIKIVGELQVVRQALNGQQPGSTPEGSEAPGSTRRPREGEQAGVH